MHTKYICEIFAHSAGNELISRANVQSRCKQRHSILGHVPLRKSVVDVNLRACCFDLGRHFHAPVVQSRLMFPGYVNVKVSYPYSKNLLSVLPS